MTENDVQIVRLQTQVLMCGFVTFGSFHAK